MIWRKRSVIISYSTRYITVVFWHRRSWMMPSVTLFYWNKLRHTAQASYTDVIYCMLSVKILPQYNAIKSYQKRILKLLEGICSWSLPFHLLSIYQDGISFVIPYCYFFMLSVFLFWFTYYVQSFGWNFKPRSRLHDLVVSGTLN